MVCRKITPVSNATIRALWLDPDARMDSIAARAGCSYDTVRNRALAMGLPPRTVLRDTTHFHRTPLFRAMWRAGVSAYAMARHYGVSQSAISRAAHKAGLPERKAGLQPPITLTGFVETLLAARMSAARAAELARGSDPQAVPVPVDLEALFPGPADALPLTGQHWRALMEAGLTAREAAARRGLSEKAAYKWADRHGLQWAAPEQAVA